MTSAASSRAGRTERIAVLADAHLRADGSETSDVAELWRRALTALRPTVDRIVFAGDLFDLDRSRRPFEHRKELGRVRAHHRWLGDLFDELGIELLHGNHDRVLVEQGAPSAVEMRVGALRVRVEHGHRFDAWIKKWPEFTSAVTWVSGVAERGPAGLLRGLRTIESTLAGGGGDGSLETRAQAWLERQDELDVLVLGHTHVAGIDAVESGESCVVNPGASSPATLRWAEIDGRSCVLSLHEVRAGERSRCVRKRSVRPQ